MKKALVIILIAFSFQLNAQFKVNDAVSIIDAVKMLEYGGVDIYDVSLIMPMDNVSKKDNPFGIYSDGYGLLGLSEGAIFTTGSAKNAEGPNNSYNSSQSNTNDEYMPTDQQYFDLIAQLAAKTSGYEPDPDTATDYIILEYAFTSPQDVLEYTYVFGSEEYPWPNHIAKTDMFGFFISGPGFNGWENLAVVDGDVPIAVNTIHHSLRSDLYVENGNGKTPFANFYTQYDGYTVPLTIKAEIQPCLEYRVKIIILDEDWSECDSGVMIQPSPTREDEIEEVHELEDYDFGVEGCTYTRFRISKPDYHIKNGFAITYRAEYGGTAEPGVDYKELPEYITIPADSDFVDIWVVSFKDDKEEGTETVTISIYDPCGTDAEVASDETEIRDDFGVELVGGMLCLGDTLELEQELDSAYFSLEWEDKPFVECYECINTGFYPDSSTELIGNYIHVSSGCEFSDTIVLEVVDVVAEFLAYQEPDYSSMDILVDNLSDLNMNYQWDFGDGSESDEFEPIHMYELLNTSEDSSYQVSLLVTHPELGCVDSADTVVTVSPLVIPNVITPNNDGVNEFFEVTGIEMGRWTFVVYNRWGKQVWYTEEFSNNFFGEGLSDGVYYFELRNRPGDRSFKGWVLVSSGIH
jgi:gliding motility-associated-like protein